MTRHLLDLADVGPAGVVDLVEASLQPVSPVLHGLGVAMVFEKPSARTRNSTEMAVVDLGGHPVMITDAEVGIDRRETAEDVARTLGCFHRVIAARVNDHTVLERMAVALDDANMECSVVNLLSDRSHPCQAIADVLTLVDEYGDGTDLLALRGRTLAYVGDANNVTVSLAQAMLAVGVDVRVASPVGYRFDEATLEELSSFGAASGASLLQLDSPQAAAEGADVLYMCGSPWAKKLKPLSVELRSKGSRSTAAFSKRRLPMQSSFTACQPIAARRSLPRRSNRRRAASGGRLRTAERRCVAS